MIERTDSEGTSSSKNLQAFFENSLCGFIVADGQGIIQEVNARITAWTESSKDELKGIRFSDLLTIGGKIYYETHLWPLLRMQGFFDEVVVELTSVSGKKWRVLINARECKNAEGQPDAIHFTILKASDRLQYEQNLQQMKTAAELEANRQKEMVALREQLIAVLGHDLRNPLSAISVVAELLPDTPAGPVQTGLLNSLTRSSLRMKELINNIMDFARSRMGEGIKINSELVMLTPYLEQVAHELRLSFPMRKIETVLDISGPVYCDPYRIAQLSSNLLANAITHGSPDAPIYLCASQADNIFELSVANSGKPIAPELHEQLFNPFVKDSLRSSQNGLGLGLYISAEIARAHNAELTFTSDKKETRFLLQMDMNNQENDYGVTE